MPTTGKSPAGAALALALPLFASACRPPSAGPPPLPVPQPASAFLAGGEDEPRGPLEQGGVLPKGTGGHPRLLLTPRKLAALRASATRGSTTWLLLKARCDGHARGDVSFPDGADYPTAPGIGEGYQGSGYFDPLLELSLCYQIAREAEPKRALAYADAAAVVLSRMSEPGGPHAVDPLRDSGYGVRFFALGMAIGYDWLGDALSAEAKARLRAAMVRWLSAYERGGFGRGHAQGNYFAGYYAAKAFSSLATEGEGEPGKAGFDDWLSRVHLGLVQPFYAAHLTGGGWPEGWNYGALGSVNMILPSLAVRSAKGIDLIRRKEAPFAFPLDQARYLMHFTWPGRQALDDRGALYSADEPSPPSAALATVVYGALVDEADPFAPTFRAFTRALRDHPAKPAAAWQDVLFWGDEGEERDYRGEPRSYVARGMNAVAMRSSWADDAVWASFTSGPYVGNPDSGEMYFDQGSLVVVRGNRPLLCNAHAGLLRHSPGTRDGDGLFDRIYADLYGKPPQGGGRTLFNVLRLDGPSGGQQAIEASEAHTHLAAIEDGGAYVLARGEDLADMYQRGGKRPVKSWTRQVLYVRPGVFVTHDATEVADAAQAPILSFHLCGPATRSGDRVELGGDGGPSALTRVLPKGSDLAIVDVLGKGKVRRVDVKPGAGAAQRRWLSVFEAPAPGGTLRSATAVGVRSGEAEGVKLEGAGGAVVAVFSRGGGPISYASPPASSHFVVGLPPGAAYSVQASSGASGLEVRLSPGGRLRTSSSGVLSFRLDERGAAAELASN